MPDAIGQRCCRYQPSSGLVGWSDTAASVPAHSLERGRRLPRQGRRRGRRQENPVPRHDRGEGQLGVHARRSQSSFTLYQLGAL